MQGLHCTGHNRYRACLASSRSASPLVRPARPQHPTQTPEAWASALPPGPSPLTGAGRRPRGAGEVSGRRERLPVSSRVLRPLRRRQVRGCWRRARPSGHRSTGTSGPMLHWWRNSRGHVSGAPGDCPRGVRWRPGRRRAGGPRKLVEQQRSSRGGHSERRTPRQLVDTPGLRGGDVKRVASAALPLSNSATRSSPAAACGLIERYPHLPDLPGRDLAVPEPDQGPHSAPEALRCGGNNRRTRRTPSVLRVRAVSLHAALPYRARAGVPRHAAGKAEIPGAGSCWRGAASARLAHGTG